MLRKPKKWLWKSRKHLKSMLKLYTGNTQVIAIWILLKQPFCSLIWRKILIFLSVNRTALDISEFSVTWNIQKDFKGVFESDTGVSCSFKNLKNRTAKEQWMAELYLELILILDALKKATNKGVVVNWPLFVVVSLPRETDGIITKRFCRSIAKCLFCSNVPFYSHTHRSGHFLRDKPKGLSGRSDLWICG